MLMHNVSIHDDNLRQWLMAHSLLHAVYFARTVISIIHIKPAQTALARQRTVADVELAAIRFGETVTAAVRRARDSCTETDRSTETDRRWRSAGREPNDGASVSWWLLVLVANCCPAMICCPNGGSNPA